MTPVCCSLAAPAPSFLQKGGSTEGNRRCPVLLSWPSHGDWLVIVGLPVGFPGKTLTGVLEPTDRVIIFPEAVGFVPSVIIAMLADVRQ